MTGACNVAHNVCEWTWNRLTLTDIWKAAMQSEEEKLLDKLRKIEALFAGATTPGERDAAWHARERVMARLREFEVAEPPVEYRFSLSNTWSKRLFLALIRRYGLRPYRYPRQRRTTVRVRVPRRFVNEVLWPEFQALNTVLSTYLDEVADRVIAEAMQAGSFEDEDEESPQGALDFDPGSVSPPSDETFAQNPTNEGGADPQVSAQNPTKGKAPWKKRRGRRR